MRGGYRQNAGRKKGFSALEAEKARNLICERLSKNLLPIIDILITRAKEGDIKAARELFDRAYGKSQPSLSDENDTAKEPMKIVIIKSYEEVEEGNLVMPIELAQKNSLVLR